MARFLRQHLVTVILSDPERSEWGVEGPAVAFRSSNKNAPLSEVEMGTCDPAAIRSYPIPVITSMRGSVISSIA